MSVGGSECGCNIMCRNNLESGFGMGGTGTGPVRNNSVNSVKFE